MMKNIFFLFFILLLPLTATTTGLEECLKDHQNPEIQLQIAQLCYLQQKVKQQSPPREAESFNKITTCYLVETKGLHLVETSNATLWSCVSTMNSLNMLYQKKYNPNEYQHAENYDGCILTGMREVKSKIKAQQIAKACRKKHNKGAEFHDAMVKQALQTMPGKKLRSAFKIK